MGWKWHCCKNVSRMNCCVKTHESFGLNQNEMDQCNESMNQWTLTFFFLSFVFNSIRVIMKICKTSKICKNIHILQSTSWNWYMFKSKLLPVQDFFTPCFLKRVQRWPALNWMLLSKIPLGALCVFEYINHVN